MTYRVQSPAWAPRHQETVRSASGTFGPLATFLAGIAAVLLAGVALAIADRNGLQNAVLLRDPAAHFDFPAMAGLVSFAGVACLMLTTGVTFFAAQASGERNRLLWFVGAFSLLLALDDQFLLHEIGLPRLTGLPEQAYLALYGCAGLFLLVCSRIALGMRRVLGLVPALAFLALSVLADLEPLGQRPSYAMEDLPKLAGWAAWLAFWWSCSLSGLKGSRGERQRF